MQAKSMKDAAPTQDFFAGYERPANGFDEAVGSDGAVRPHWRAFSEAFGALSPDEQFQRQERLRRLVLENGIAQVDGDFVIIRVGGKEEQTEGANPFHDGHHDTV